MFSKTSISCILMTVFLSWLLLAPNDQPSNWTLQNHALVKGWVSRIRDVFRGLWTSTRAQERSSDGLTPEKDGHGQKPLKIFTKSELSKYKGDGGKKGPVYFAILGRVYDVTKGRKHYGPGEAYSIFAGIDASRAFVTGDFTKAGLTDDIESLKSSQLFELKHWVSFYDEEYPFIGYLSNRFYDSNGNPTELLKDINHRIEEYKEEVKKMEAAKNQLPACNHEWKPTGSRVWCSQKSGGISRDWAGVPRQHFKPGSTSPTCVCERDPRNHRHHTLKEYKGCDSLATSCTPEEGRRLHRPKRCGNETQDENSSPNIPNLQRFPSLKLLKPDQCPWIIVQCDFVGGLFYKIPRVSFLKLSVLWNTVLRACFPADYNVVVFKSNINKFWLNRPR